MNLGEFVSGSDGLSDLYLVLQMIGLAFQAIGLGIILGITFYNIPEVSPAFASLAH